jgi:hypothetical protein
MGITDFILGRKKRDLDYGDVKSHILAKPFGEQPETIGSKLGMAQEFPKEPFMPEPFTPAPQPFSQIDSPGPGLARAGPGRDFSLEMERRDFAVDQKRTSLDVLDRLSIIESQLQAIRSQTETINERLKNLDARLGRRY